MESVLEKHFENMMLDVLEKKLKQSPAIYKKISQLEEEMTGLKERLTFVAQQLKGTKDELRSTKEELRSTKEELRSTKEELRSTKEELRSTKDELRSTKDELRSTKEELRSTKEELAGNKLEYAFNLANIQQELESVKSLLDISEASNRTLKRKNTDLEEELDLEELPTKKKYKPYNQKVYEYNGYIDKWEGDAFFVNANASIFNDRRSTFQFTRTFRNKNYEVKKVESGGIQYFRCEHPTMTKTDFLNQVNMYQKQQEKQEEQQEFDLNFLFEE